MGAVWTSSPSPGRRQPALAVQLHDGLGGGHDLGAGRHVKEGVLLHGAGVIQPDPHVVEHRIPIGFLVYDLSPAHHRDDGAGEIPLVHVVLDNGVDARKPVIGFDRQR